MKNIPSFHFSPAKETAGPASPPFPSFRPALLPFAARSLPGPSRAGLLRASAPARPSSTAARTRSAFSAYARTRRSSSPSLPAGPTPSDARASAARTRHFSLSLRSRPHPSAATVPFPSSPHPFPFLSPVMALRPNGKPPPPSLPQGRRLNPARASAPFPSTP